MRMRCSLRCVSYGVLALFLLSPPFRYLLFLPSSPIFGSVGFFHSGFGGGGRASSGHDDAGAVVGKKLEGNLKIFPPLPTHSTPFIKGGKGMYFMGILPGEKRKETLG